MGEPNKVSGNTAQSQERPRRQDYQADWTFSDALSEYADSLEAERDHLREREKELVGALRNSHNYILHVGNNYTMRGEPHPQQMIVDANEAVLQK